MFNKITKKYYLVAMGVICLIALALFYKSLFNFFTNDDFFFLKIAKVSSWKEFFNFFNLIKDPQGIGVYRPLTLRVYYFLSVEFFRLNPLPLHIISFITFFVDIFLVGELTKLITRNNKMALLVSFLYATSTTHFGQLFYIGAFQELFLTMVFLASVIFFIKYEIEVKTKHTIWKLIASFLFFILAVMSKETAVVLPVVFVFSHYYLKLTKRTTVSFKTLVLSLLPFVVTLGAYLFLHFRYFGLIEGESYIWDFSPTRAINSLGWYGLWSLNIPEMLVDFVGPGLHLNPNLLKYWSKEIIPIFGLFALQVIILIISLVKFIKENIKTNKENWLLVLFSLFWFITTLTPVLFLPVHKFTYYLTLPLIGVVIIISKLLLSLRKPGVVIAIFSFCWLLTSYLTLSLTKSTNWITTGAKTARTAYDFFQNNKEKYTGKTLVFYDTKEDSTLPWSPTEVVKVVLSDNSFFQLYFNNIKAVYYGGDKSIKGDIVTIKSRDFLGY